MSEDTSIHSRPPESTPACQPKLDKGRWRFGPGDGKVNSIACLTFEEAHKSMMFSVQRSKYIAATVDVGGTSRKLFLNIASIARRIGLTKKQIEQLKQKDSSEEVGQALTELLNLSTLPPSKKFDVLKELGPITRRLVEGEQKIIESVVKFQVANFDDRDTQVAPTRPKANSPQPPNLLDTTTIGKIQKKVEEVISNGKNPNTILALISLYHSNNDAAKFMRNKIPEIINNLLTKIEFKEFGYSG